MSHIMVELDLPHDWREFRVPPALNQRLHVLLDKQDRDGKLSRQEREEAKAITELVDMLSLLRIRARRAALSQGDE